jgi:hypothetical protein
MQEFVCTGHGDPIVRCPDDEDITIGVDCHALEVAPGAAPRGNATPQQHARAYTICYRSVLLYDPCWSTAHPFRTLFPIFLRAALIPHPLPCSIPSLRNSIPFCRVQLLLFISSFLSVFYSQRILHSFSVADY